MTIPYFGSITQFGQPILVGLVGSKAYGLNHSESDDDYLGVYLAPTSTVLGLEWYPQKSTKVYNEDLDAQYHELQKYLNLAIKGNPTVCELMWLEEYLLINSVGQGLLDIRHRLLVKENITASYLGYATSQLDRYYRQDPSKRKLKHLRHCFRLLLQAEQLLKNGSMTVKLTDEQISQVQSFSVLDEDDVRKSFESQRDTIMAAEQSAVNFSTQDKASSVANEFLLQVRVGNLRNLYLHGC